MARRVRADQVSDSAPLKKRKMNHQDTMLELKFDRILDTRTKEVSIIGKFISEERVLNSSNLGADIHRAWPVDHPFEVHEIGDNLFFFVFQTLVDKWKVLMSSKPWVVTGKLLVIRDLPDKIVGMEEIRFLDFKTQDFWVQVYGTEEEEESTLDILEESNLFDQVVSVDGRPHPSFERLKVRVVLSRPLPTGFFMRSSDGTTFPVIFKYENLPDMCPCCGLFGHDSDVCWVVEDCSIMWYDDSIRGKPIEQPGETFQGEWDGTL